jgi:Acetyltransferase (GNAT) family
MQSIERRVTENFIESMAADANAIGGAVERFDAVTCIRTPIPLGAFNLAFILDKAAVNPTILERIQMFFDGLKSEWRFILPPSLASVSWELPRQIAVARWTREPAMVMFRDSASFRPVPSGLRIRKVRTLDDLKLWNRTCAVGFGEDPGLFELFNRPVILSAKGTSMYIGECSEKPVATSLLYLSNGVAGIYGVSTLPEFRGRGFGGALTAFAVKEGFSNGCDLASLQSSSLGVPVYFKLGFRFVFDYECWTISPRMTVTEK